MTGTTKAGISEESQNKSSGNSSGIIAAVVATILVILALLIFAAWKNRQKTKSVPPTPEEPKLRNFTANAAFSRDSALVLGGSASGGTGPSYIVPGDDVNALYIATPTSGEGYYYDNSSDKSDIHTHDSVGNNEAYDTPSPAYEVIPATAGISSIYDNGYDLVGLQVGSTPYSIPIEGQSLGDDLHKEDFC